jgi:uncharacterized radical SAM superfamily protein
MPDVSTPEKLKDFASHHWVNKGVGLLVSGGSTPDGKVPLEEFYPALRWIKDNTGLIINLHTGLMSRKEIIEIAAIGVDVASIDLVGDNRTIKRVYGLNANPSDYENTLHGLKDAGVNVMPHVCVGLDYGKLVGEIHALEIAAEVRPEVIGVIALMPTEGTPMESSAAPRVEDVTRVIAEARRISPMSEVSLGCMHSRIEKLRLEEESIKAGVTRITLPSRLTVEKAAEAGFEVRKLDGCCGLPRNLEDRALHVV